MLNDAVLKPIGESLKIIVDRGHFIVQKNLASYLLEVNYTTCIIFTHGMYYYRFHHYFVGYFK